MRSRDLADLSAALDESGVTEHLVADKGEVVRTLDEDEAHRIYDRWRDAGREPRLSSRRIVAGHWHVDASAVPPMTS